MANGLNNTVSVINVATNTVTGTVTGVFSGPVSVAFTPDGTKAYITNAGNSTVSVINVATNTVTTTVAGTFHTPEVVAFTPNGTTAYVTDEGIGFFAVSIINVATNTVTGTVSDPQNTFDGPRGIAITPDGTKAYVTNSTGNSVSIIFIGSSSSSVMAPSAIQGCKTRNVFLTQIDLVNIITWSAPVGGTPVAYQLYRDVALTNFIATVPATGQLRYEDHNRRNDTIYTYYLIAVYADGTISNTVSVTVTTPC